MKTVADVLKLIKDEEVAYVDVRFTDPKGKLQHVTLDVDLVDEDFFEEGFMFDGSSIAGWKSIDQSDMKLILDHWDDLLRLVGSLKLGVVRAADLTRVLQTNDRPTRLARALQELGRLIKTLYLLRFIDDEAYRRRILVQLNRGEGRHQLARALFHGKRGELRQRYREGQEDQLGALGLVVNLVVLWNTIYMDAALNQLVAEGYDVRPEDVARLSPLGSKHINMLGRYAFSLPEFVARGELRPLRDPQNVDPDEA